MDALAPITEKGVIYLLSDGTTRKFKDGVIDDDFKKLPHANDEELKSFASQKYNIIFKGDNVVIKRGRKMLGEVKTVKGYYKYVVSGTYGKCYIGYLLFTDGTKVNINHCDVVGVNYKDYTRNGETTYYRTYEERINHSLFYVGGRL